MYLFGFEATPNCGGCFFSAVNLFDLCPHIFNVFLEYSKENKLYYV